MVVWDVADVDVTALGFFVICANSKVVDEFAGVVVGVVPW